MRLKDVATATGKNLANNLMEKSGISITNDDLASFKQGIVESAQAALRDHKAVQQQVQMAIVAAVALHKDSIDKMVEEVVVDALLQDMQNRVNGEVRRLMNVALDEVGQAMIVAIKSARKAP